MVRESLFGLPSTHQEDRHGNRPADPLDEQCAGDSPDHPILEEPRFRISQLAGQGLVRTRDRRPDELFGRLLRRLARRMWEHPFEPDDEPSAPLLRALQDHAGDLRTGGRRHRKLGEYDGEIPATVDPDRGLDSAALDDRDRGAIRAIDQPEARQSQRLDDVMGRHGGGEAGARKAGEDDRAGHEDRFPFIHPLRRHTELIGRERSAYLGRFIGVPFGRRGGPWQQADNPQVLSAVRPAVGLPFGDIVHSEEIPWSALSGRLLAVDGNNAVYQFLATIRQRDGQPFSDPQGHITSHLIGVLYRTTSLLAQGVRPAWVFDGKPPDLKAGTLGARFRAKERAEAEWKAAVERQDWETARTKAAATSRFTRPMAAEAIELLTALGVPTVQAPSEGEAQAARMASDGRVWAAGSEDYDSLLFGAPRLVRGLAARPRGGNQPAAHLIDRDKLLATLGISGEELILLGLVVGTDFNDGAKGYGPKKGLKLVQRHLGWNETLKAADLDPAEVEPAAAIFRSPQVTPVTDLAFRPIDEAAVERILIEGRGFSEARVHAALQRAVRSPPVRVTPDGRTQSQLDRFGGA
jgi:flap endonuclease-1